MAFSKIRQTIAALKAPPPPELTIQEQIDAYGQDLRQRASGVRPQELMRYGVYFVILVPSSYLIINILHKLLHVSEQTVGAIGILLGALAGMSIQKIHDEIVRRVPFQKLNPYFGSKIEQTIVAFRRSSKHA